MLASGVVYRLLYLLVVTAYALHESLLVVFKPDTVEGHRVVWCAVRLEKWVYTFCVICLFIVHDCL